LLDVDPDREEVLGNGAGHVFVGIDLGFQPSASASGRGGAEIHEDRLLFGFRLRQSLVRVARPLNGHGSLPWGEGSTPLWMHCPCPQNRRGGPRKPLDGRLFRPSRSTLPL